MDIFLIETKNEQNINKKQLLEFQKKEISNPTRLVQHCLSYLMLDRILKDYYAIEERTIDFVDNKPCLKNAEKHFSISHSHEFIALAFSNFPCGIDIEKNTPRNTKKIANRMGFNVNTMDEFYAEWTTYEAKYKLASDVKTSRTYKIGDYTLSVASSYSDEKFDLYLQFGSEKSLFSD